MNKIENLKNSITEQDIDKTIQIFRSLDRKDIIEIQADLLVGSVICKNIKAVKFLIEEGVNPNSIDKQSGYSALHFSVEEEQIDILQYLISIGANIDSKDNYGNTPLGKAIFKRNSLPELIKILIKNGANINEKNNSGNSPKDLADKFKFDLNQFIE